MSTAAPCRVTSFSALDAAPNVCVVVSKFSHYMRLCMYRTLLIPCALSLLAIVLRPRQELIKCIILCLLTAGCMHFGLKFARPGNKSARSPLSRKSEWFIPDVHRDLYALAEINYGATHWTLMRRVQCWLRAFTAFWRRWKFNQRLVRQCALHLCVVFLGSGTFC